MTLTKLGNIVNQSPAGKNVLDNANFDVWQRGTSGFTASVCTADQWLLSPSTSGAVEVHQSTAGPNTIMFNNLYVDVTAADTSPTGSDFLSIIQKICGGNARWIIDVPATLSFWVKSSTPGIYCVSLRKHDYSYSYIIEYTIDSADTWEKKVVNFGKIDRDIIGGLNLTDVYSLSVAFVLMNGTTYATSTNDEWVSGNYLSTLNQTNLLASTSNYFQLAGVQLEPGRIATDFEYRTWEEEFRRCQKYYRVLVIDAVGYQQAGYALLEEIGFENPMISSPTVLQLTNNVSFAQNNMATTTSSYLVSPSKLSVYRQASVSGFCQFSERVSLTSAL
jgi:hypothetical protein